MPLQGRPPRLPETLVARERLYAVLDRTSTAPLTLLVAPAGTGKTVLLSAWAERHLAGGDEVAWIAAHDHHLLKTRLCEAVGKKSGPILKVLEDASKAGVVPEVIVVDDAHLMDRELLLLLEEILNSAPDAVRLVLASRRDLALPVLELDLTGRANTLRSRDLRFNDAGSHRPRPGACRTRHHRRHRGTSRTDRGVGRGIGAGGAVTGQQPGGRHLRIPPS